MSDIALIEGAVLDGLTQRRLHELLSYDRETGVFKWRSKHYTRTPGSQAGSPSNGYTIIGIDGKKHAAHRLAFLYELGFWPRFDVDHIDGNKENNSWFNLRDVPKRLNLQNQTRAHRRNGRTSQYLGVSWKKARSKWASTIADPSGVVKHIGYFTSEEEAARAYVKAKRALHAGSTV